ncbi:MAG: cell surface protein [Rickettsia endosymbiont of Argas persicus]
MAKNMKSKSSKLAKLFLLGCANAAILTAIPQTVMAVDIEIRDILHKAPEYQNLIPADKLALFRAIQAQEDFDDLFNELMPQEKRLFNDELREVTRTQEAAPVLNGARERREARAGGNVTANL